MAKRSLSSRELRAACETLETSVLHRQRASAEEIARAKPGQPANADKGPLGWLRFYGQLRIWQDRALVERNDDTAVADLLTRTTTQQPATVRLTTPDDSGDPRSLRIVSCYAKSRRALLMMHYRDQRAAWLAQQMKRLQQLGSPDDLALLGRVAEELDYQLRCLAWAATTAGPWLPFDPLEGRPATPPWLSLCSAEDIVIILAAFQRVNHKDLADLRFLLDRLGDHESGGPMGWGVVVAAMAESQGIPLETMDRDRALSSELAALYARAEAVERARDKAARK